MNTPHAILIGLSLIAAAIFFKGTAVNPAHAKEALDARYGGKTVGFDCLQQHDSEGEPGKVHCFRLDDQGAVYIFDFNRMHPIGTPKENFWFKYE